MKTGQYPKQSEAEFIKEQAAKKSREATTLSKRDLIDPEKRQEIKGAATYDRLLEKAKALKAQGKTWREIHYKLHMARYKGFQATIKKEIGFAD